MLLLTGHTLKDPGYTIDYHRGELLSEQEMAGVTPSELAQIVQTRRQPTVLDADADSILRVLDSWSAVPVSAAQPA